MDNIISINNLTFKYGDNVIFNNFSCDFKRGSFTTILGNNSSGKSTLAKILLGLLEFEGAILVDGMILNDNNLFDIRSEVGVVFDNPDNCLISEKVIDDMSFSLENLGYNSCDIYQRINEVSDFLGVTNLLEKNPHQLSGGEKQLICIGCAIITKPKILILDEALSMLDDKAQEKILNLLKKINEDLGVTIINITHNIEESVYGSHIMLISDGTLIVNDEKLCVYNQEKLLKSVGFGLPFMVDLSNKLSYYELVDNIIFDMEKMIDLLWD